MKMMMAVKALLSSRWENLITWLLFNYTLYINALCQQNTTDQLGTATSPNRFNELSGWTITSYDTIILVCLLMPNHPGLFCSVMNHSRTVCSFHLQQGYVPYNVKDRSKFIWFHKYEMDYILAMPKVECIYNPYTLKRRDIYANWAFICSYVRIENGAVVVEP